MKRRVLAVLVSMLFALAAAGPTLAGNTGYEGQPGNQSNGGGSTGYEGQPGNQGNGQGGYEGQPGNQGGH
jgi:hypothetical protein